SVYTAENFKPVYESRHIKCISEIEFNGRVECVHCQTIQHRRRNRRLRKNINQQTVSRRKMCRTSIVFYLVGNVIGLRTSVIASGVPAERTGNCSISRSS